MMTPKHDSCDLPSTNTVTPDCAGAGLYHASGRRVRSERLKAVMAVMVVFLRHRDPKTSCIGHWSPQGDFIPLDTATIAREAGLCRRRCERAIVYLKSIGRVMAFPQHDHCNPVHYTGFRVVRAITPAFFDWEGLSGLWGQIWSDALRGIEAEGGRQ